MREAARHLLDKKVTAVATHTHTDHVGNHHEFEHTLVHELEADELRSPRDRGTLLASVMGAEEIAKLAKAGYPFDGDLITALPIADYDMASYRLQDAPVTEIVTEGDVVDIGNRHFEVLHLPGHSPGSIGLWEAKTGTLFSGDAIYDGPLLDEIDGADIPTYVRTMKRLRDLPVRGRPCRPRSQLRPRAPDRAGRRLPGETGLRSPNDQVQARTRAGPSSRSASSRSASLSPGAAC